MAVHLFTSYAKKIQEKSVQASLLAGKLSTEYDFVGNKTVKVLIPQTVEMKDYQRTGSNRYGTPEEMQDLEQEMTLTQDKAFSLTIDKGNNQEQGHLKQGVKMLALQVKQRGVPTADKYGFQRLSELAGGVGGGSTTTKTNIYERICAGTEHLDDNEIAEGGRTLYISVPNYKWLKLCPEFTHNDAINGRVVSKGVVGELDGMAVVKVPKSRMPAGVNFIITQKDCATMPMTLNDTKLHQDPPGISGNLLEGRMIYDLFVFDANKDGVYVDKDVVTP